MGNTGQGETGAQLAPAPQLPLGWSPLQHSEHRFSQQTPLAHSRSPPHHSPMALVAVVVHA